MKHSIFSRKAPTWLPALGTALCMTATPALAADAAPAQESPQFDFGLSAGLTSFALTNTHFGAGQLGANLSNDIARTELYLAPRVNMTWKQSDSSTVYGGLRGVTSMTRGDGDSYGKTVGEHWQFDGGGYQLNGTPIPKVIGKNMSDTSLDWAYLGWKSGNLFPALGQDGLDLSFGRQDFQLGDGMVLSDGTDEATQSKGLYWMGIARQAWNNTAIARINKAPFRAELFALEASSDYGDDTITGMNLEMADAKLGKVGMTYFDVNASTHFDINRAAVPDRKGEYVFGVHGRGKPIASLPILEVAGEYNRQKGGAANRDANAWFAEASLFMPFLPWYPTLGYRYASFSGDKASTPGTNEGWDYLYYGYTQRGPGYWYQGIVVGTYETRPSNLNTHFVHLTLAPPIQGTWIKLQYYDYRFDQASTANSITGRSTLSDKFATEWDLILGYSPTKKADYLMIYGKAQPGEGGKNRYAGLPISKPIDLDASMLQFTMVVHF